MTNIQSLLKPYFHGIERCTFLLAICHQLVLESRHVGPECTKHNNFGEAAACYYQKAHFRETTGKKL